MSLFEETFTRRPAVLPVIHVESLDQALRNAHLARQKKCDGVFLINHGMSHSALLDIHHKVFAEFPDWWIGVNCLDLAPQNVFGRLTDEVAGVWVDNAAIDERTENQPAAERIEEARRESGWQGLYFGGVAFKYQRVVDDLATAARLATQYMDVVTTSGPGTAKAANVGKIRSLKKAIGTFPLAIASGISPANVHDYLDTADCFLVASAISASWTELDPQLVESLVGRVRP